jgi:hypothetical protein
MVLLSSAFKSINSLDSKETLKDFTDVYSQNACYISIQNICPLPLPRKKNKEIKNK